MEQGIEGHGTGYTGSVGSGGGGGGEAGYDGGWSRCQAGSVTAYGYGGAAGTQDVAGSSGGFGYGGNGGSYSGGGGGGWYGGGGGSYGSRTDSSVKPNLRAYCGGRWRWRFGVYWRRGTVEV